MKYFITFLKEWIPGIILALIISLFLKTYVAEATIVPTGSMLPTIQINDRIIVEKLIQPSKLKHGDIVVFYPPIADDTPYVKRLIGIGGDEIEIKEGYLFRNGTKIKEPYIKAQMTYNFGPVTVPNDNFFFLGDNRNQSYDSHLWPTHFVEKDKIIGKAIFRFYPLSKIGLIQ